jgi:hypothetical protein
MAKYAFVPIPPEEMLKFARALKLGQGAILSNAFVSGAGKAVSRFFGGCLRHLSAKDMLFVVVHGSGGGSRKVGAERNGVMKVYSPEQLADVLQKEGLTRSFVDLRLAVCGSAENKALAGLPSFAERLGAELVGAGYSNIKVMGYKGLVSPTTGGVDVLRAGKDGGKYYSGEEPESFEVYG